MANEIYYLARKSCGCAAGLVVDIPELRESVSQHVAAFIRAGLTVDRVTMDGVTTARWRCSHVGPVVNTGSQGPVQ